MTITQAGEGLFRDRGSRFIAFSFPVISEEEIRVKLEDLRKKYHDARHHCYAWRLGPAMNQYRTNDDGEPSNSAGKPILGQIQARNLTNVLVVVVRYFGGTLLGVGGLINAYRTAAAEALENATAIEKFVHTIFQVRFEYLSMNTVMRIFKEQDIGQSEQVFGLNCSVKASVRKSMTGKFIAAFEPYREIALEFLYEE